MTSATARRREGSGSVTGLGGSWIALGFVFASLVALVLLPWLVDRRERVIQAEITRVLEPARAVAAEIQVTQARGRGAFQAFLLSGEGQFRRRYVEARDREQLAFDSLAVLAEEMELDVRRHMAELADASFLWHFSHEPVLAERVPREALMEDLGGEEERYRDVVDATDDLRGAISREVDQARSRISEARQLQIRLSVGLLALALAATVAVALLGWRLFQSTRQAERRRRDAVQARREADALLRATADGVFGMDLEGTCTFMNRAGAELLGYARGELVGRKIHPLIHPSRSDGSPCPEEECPAFRALRAEATVRETQAVLRRKDGTDFPARISARPMVDGLEIRGAVVTFLDVTTTRRRQEALRQAVRARDEVLAVVSHDLRNPVGTIYSGATLLLDVELPESRRRQHLERIRRSARRATRLIRDLLDVARIEAGTLSVVPSEVDVESLTQEALEGVADRAREKGIELGRETPDGADRVVVDRDRLLQALSNLLENAVKFTEPGGRVTLRARREDGLLVLEVDDTGPGISPEERERLFDRFWQARRADRDGAGLGLAIVKGIAEAHGGSIELESAPGGGARFILRVATEEGPG